MQKRQMSVKNMHGQAENSEKSISAKLFNLTGLRIFQAKFMEELNPHKNYLPQKNSVLAESEIKKRPLIEIKTVKKENIAPEIFQERNKGNADKPFTITEIDKDKFLIKDKENKEKEMKPNRQLKYCQPKGLHNIGNTCYMNSILQNLFHLPRLTTAFLEEFEGRGRNLKQDFLSQTARTYLDLLKQMIQKGNYPVTPSAFKSAIGSRKGRFRGSSQQDAQELLTAFLEIINEECSRLKDKPKYKELEGDPEKKPIKEISEEWWSYYKLRDDSIVCDLFQGQILSTVTCKKCKSRSVTFDNFWGIPLGLNKKYRSIPDLLKSTWGLQTQITDYHCNKCKKMQTCSRNYEFFKLPEILTIQLKRFEFGKWRKQKIKDRIQLTIQLDLRPFVSLDSTVSKTKYKLVGIVNHYGEVDYGHYTATIYSQYDKQWFQANDSKISSRSSPENDESESAYMLFYERV